MRAALLLAQRGYGNTSPNPMVGAVLARGSKVLASGWHRRAGESHAEIEALNDAVRKGHPTLGATLYVTLEPCSTHGRTPPCTDAIIRAGIKRVVVGASDPNPRHAARGFAILRKAGLEVTTGVLGPQCEHLNEAFNHWITHGTPWVTVKAAMTLDGKIASASGESKWITSGPARRYGMRLRRGADAILAGVNTIIADNPALTMRPGPKTLRRLVLDPRARTPLNARVLNDERKDLTTVVVSSEAPRANVGALARLVRVLEAPTSAGGGLDLKWLLQKLGKENVTHLLVEGGGETNAWFLMNGFAQRVAFFYAPKILGGRDSRPAVGGEGAENLSAALELTDVQWRRIGADLLLLARVAAPPVKLRSTAARRRTPNAKTRRKEAAGSRT